MGGAGLNNAPGVAWQDIDGNVHLKNLSVNAVASEEDALNALFLGDTNRCVGVAAACLADRSGGVVARSMACRRR